MTTGGFQTKSATRGERKQSPSRPSTRRIWYALGITLSVIVAIVSLAVTANPLGLFQSLQQADRSSERAGGEDQRTGRIVLQISPDQCRQMEFDNVTGQIGGKSAPCETTVDSDGAPLPLGTLRRLDAISKSFAHGGN